MAITNYLASKSELKDYIKRGLGEPVHRTELTNDHLDDIINYAIDRFVEFADDGVQMRFFNLDVSSGTQEYQLVSNVHSIKNIFINEDYKIDAPLPGRATADTYGRILVAGSQSASIFSYELTRSKLMEVNFLTKKRVIFDYNTTTKKLYFLQPPQDAVSYGIIYYEKVDYSDETSSIYDHYWIKRYATELGRRQWAYNLMKYEGTILPGGLQHNAAAILQEAKENIEKLEEELEGKYQEPIDILYG